MSSSLGFAPVLHNITPERVVFCYRENDSDSIEVANYYKTLRGLPASNLIALPCSDNLIITESDYVNTIETPLQSAINSLNVSESSGDDIWVIILGYNVPVMYYADDIYEYSNSPKAIASRLHRLGFEEDNAFANPTYNRRSFSFFDGNDASQVYITAVINGPTKKSALKLIDRSIDVDNQIFVNGSIYIDPYGLRETDEQLQYENDLLEFINNEINNTGLQFKSTTLNRSGRDPSFIGFRNDSFYWGWETSNSTSTVFKKTSAKRVFLYNADDESAYYLKDELSEEDNKWCSLGINIEPGYACCAGSVSECLPENFLRPRPFFETLHQGATIGEAFLFSSPVVDWKTILIGDPLLVVNFPVNVPVDQVINDTSITNDEFIRLSKEYIEASIAYAKRKQNLIMSLIDKVVASGNFGEENYLLYPINKWKRDNSDNSIVSQFGGLVHQFVQYISTTDRINFATWLSNNSEKTTADFNYVLVNTIPTEILDASYVKISGSWSFEFVYVNTRQVFERVYFELQISDKSDFSNIVETISAFDDVSGWEYEREKFSFVSMLLTGVTSNFSQRRIRYNSDESHYLVYLGVYFLRYRTLDKDGFAISGWSDSNQIIIKT